MTNLFIIMYDISIAAALQIPPFQILREDFIPKTQCESMGNYAVNMARQPGVIKSITYYCTDSAIK